MWRPLKKAIRDWARRAPVPQQPRIGLALGGGFARSLVHLGVLQVLEEHHIPVHAIAGISSGAIIASAWASGTPLEEIVSQGACTSFNSYARWTLSRLGLASNEPMEPYLRKVLRHVNFEDMQTPLAVVATDLLTGAPVIFKGQGDIVAAVRASCAYPGLFLPVEANGRWLVDGAVSTDVPVEAVRDLGATHVIGVYLHTVTANGLRPSNLLQVVSQCFAIMQDRKAIDGRHGANILLEPRVAGFAWNCFDRASEIVQIGRDAALEALPKIQGWFEKVPSRRAASATPNTPLTVALAPVPSAATSPESQTLRS